MVFSMVPRPPVTDGETDLRGERETGRSAVARSFLLAFGRPGKEQRDFLLSSDWLEDLHSRGWLRGTDPKGLREGLPEDLAEWESLFLSTFEVGFPAPTVPLFETHYLKEGNTPAAVHENILFYKAFGCEVAAGDADNPDHLRHQLAFLLVLFWIEDGSSSSPDAIESARLARRDFIGRHLRPWIPKAAALAGKKAHPLWEALLLALSAWLKEAGEFRVSPEVSPGTPVLQRGVDGFEPDTG